jgi:RNA polymerase sigma-70 factor (ECF subfamily)
LTAPDLLHLYELSEGERFGLHFSVFAQVLREIVELYLPSELRAEQTAKLFQSLRLKDLALARACVEGSETAWNCFLLRYRANLYTAAVSMTKDPAIAHELADSLWGELLLNSCRRLASYTGRGSLENWLKALLAQAYVDEYRSRKRFVSLDEHPASIARVLAKDWIGQDRIDPRLENTVARVLLELSAEERFLLAGYFLDQRNLAQLGEMAGIHESSVSRRLRKITQSIRKRVIAGLREQGVGTRAAQELLSVDVRDLSIDVRSCLSESR